MLIPGIFTFLDRILGPLFSVSKDAVEIGLKTIKNPTISSIFSVIEGSIASMTDAQKMEIKGEIATLLAQSGIDDDDAKSEHWIQYAWRPFLAWGLSVNIVAHATIITIIDVLELFGYNPPALTPIDTVTLTLMCGLLGLYMSARTIEKYSDNTGN